MSDSRNARRACLLDALFQLFLCLLRDGLVIRRVQRRVDGDEPDDPVPELEDPKSRGGRARIMRLDVEEVYASEDFLGRVFNERSIFPIIPWEEGSVRVLEPKQEERIKWLVALPVDVEHDGYSWSEKGWQYLQPAQDPV